MQITISRIKKLSKKKVDSDEFTTQNIQQKINFIKASYPDKFIIQNFLVNEQSLVFLVSTFEKYFKLINKITIRIKIINNQNYFVDVRALESEKKKQDKLRNMVHKQLVKSIKQQQQQKFQTNKMDVKTPPIRINVDVLEKNALKIIGDVQRNLRNESFSALEDSGYLFMWTIASKFIEAVAFMIQKGYIVVDSIVWIKKGKHKDYVNRMGYHLRHNKEICLLGLKGSPPSFAKHFTATDIIESIPGKNSEKPKELDDNMKAVTQGGYICKIFARDQNDCEDCVSIGNQLTIEK